MKRFQKVKLLTNKYYTDGLIKDDIGRIMEVYPDGFYEVEFFYSDGGTIAFFAFPESELAPIKENEGRARAPKDKGSLPAAKDSVRKLGKRQ